ncbi:Crotonase, core, partial [Metarhizium hybridum]
MSASGLVQATSPAQGVRLITFTRPEKRNALSRQLLDEFLVELEAASTDPAVKAIVITGTGTFFSAGADLKDIADLDSAGARSCRYLENLCVGMTAVRKPLIAAVNGPALGGGFEVALMVREKKHLYPVPDAAANPAILGRLRRCDLIFAAKSAYFALPETKRGLIPGAGGTQRLTAAVGKFRAMRTILAGKPITSEEALSWGLLCELMEDGVLLQQTIVAATALTTHGSEALELAKEAICRGENQSLL